MGYGGLLCVECGCDVRGRLVRMVDAGFLGMDDIRRSRREGRYRAQNLAGILTLVSGRVISDGMYQGTENSPRSLQVMNDISYESAPTADHTVLFPAYSWYLAAYKHTIPQTALHRQHQPLRTPSHLHPPLLLLILHLLPLLLHHFTLHLPLPVHRHRRSNDLPAACNHDDASVADEVFKHGFEALFWLGMRDGLLLRISSGGRDQGCFGRLGVNDGGGLGLHDEFVRVEPVHVGVKVDGLGGGHSVGAGRRLGRSDEAGEGKEARGGMY